MIPLAMKTRWRQPLENRATWALRLPVMPVRAITSSTRLRGIP